MNLCVEGFSIDSAALGALVILAVAFVLIGVRSLAVATIHRRNRYRGRHR